MLFGMPKGVFTKYMRTIEISDEAYELIDDMLAQTDAKNASDIIIGQYNLIRRLISELELAKKPKITYDFTGYPTERNVP